ncbi:MAG: T9SS type A sorting domain-containing protein, partial [Sphingomonadales bacterium]
YDGINGNANDVFNERSADFLGLSAQIGAYAAPAIANYDNDTHLELLTGQDLGGLFLLENEPGSDLSVQPNAFPGLIVFPNPTKGTLSLKGIQGNTDGTIFNLLGQKVVGLTDLIDQYTIDISDLPAGTYILKLENGQGTVVVKQK